MHSFIKTQIIQKDKCISQECVRLQVSLKNSGLRTRFIYSFKFKNWQFRTGQWLNNAIRDPDFPPHFSTVPSSFLLAFILSSRLLYHHALYSYFRQKTRKEQSDKRHRAKRPVSPMTLSPVFNLSSFPGSLLNLSSFPGSTTKTIPLMFHWPELGQVALSRCKGVQEGTSIQLGSLLS